MIATPTALASQALRSYDLGVALDGQTFVAWSSIAADLRAAAAALTAEGALPDVVRRYLGRAEDAEHRSRRQMQRRLAIPVLRDVPDFVRRTARCG